MIYIFEHALLAADNDVVNSAEMLRVLGQANTTRMWDNWDVELGGHKQDGYHFVDAAESAGIDLTDVDCAACEELLEHDTVLAHFSCGDADTVGLQGFADCFMAKNLMFLSASFQKLL